MPFFLFDLTNYQLITTTTIPSDISDTKSIVLVETSIPGQDYAPVMQTANGNRKISFTLKLIKRNNTVGNIMLVSQFERLRHQNSSVMSLVGNKKPWANPKVLYNYGVGAVPLECYVSKCDFTHASGWTNELGYPQNTEVSMELIIDQTSPLYIAEQVFTEFMAWSGMLNDAADLVASQFQNKTY